MSVNFMQVLPGGICFAHGPYEEMTCPKWPACITDPTNAQYYEMGMKKALEDPRDFAIQKLRTELAALSAEVAGLRASLGAIMKLIGDGTLVRDISGDAEPGWAMKQLPLVMALKTAQELLDAARGQEKKDDR